MKFLEKLFKVTKNDPLGIDAAADGIQQLKSRLAAEKRKLEVERDKLRDALLDDPSGDFDESAIVAQQIRVEMFEKAIEKSLDEAAAKLPNGYDTRIGLGGELLDREELARLSFARALVGKPVILTVDDTFAALSEDAEEQLHLAMGAELKGRTRVIATSRFSICPDVDMVIVMRKGTVEQVGTHDELIAQPGLYRRMYRRQMGTSLDG